PYREMKPEVEGLLEGISEGALRIQNIVDNLKEFSQFDKGSKLQILNINPLIETAIAITDNLIRKSTDYFSIKLQDNMPDIKGNQQQLEQVIINLITNACQALTNRTNKITVTSSCDNNNIIVEVKDEGVGINSEDIKYVMDPFFSNKTDVGGTGLGLYISYNIIKEHGGELKLISKEGEGTAAIINLPVS
ncbi:MAG: HAMP domain-containing sensor histidine kinase, partial [bacterium]